MSFFKGIMQLLACSRTCPCTTRFHDSVNVCTQIAWLFLSLIHSYDLSILPILVLRASKVPRPFLELLRLLRGCFTILKYMDMIASDLRSRARSKLIGSVKVSLTAICTIVPSVSTKFEGNRRRASKYDLKIIH